MTSSWFFLSTLDLTGFAHPLTNHFPASVYRTTKHHVANRTLNFNLWPVTAHRKLQSIYETTVQEWLKKENPTTPQKKLLKVWFANLTSCKIRLNQQIQFNHTILRYVLLPQFPLLFTLNMNVFHYIISPPFCNLWSRLYYTFLPYIWIHIFLRRPGLHRTPSSLQCTSPYCHQFSVQDPSVFIWNLFSIFQL